MPAKGFLTPDQRDKLQRELREQEHPDIRERILIFLLINDGKTQQEVADFVGCSLRKVSYWFTHADPDNLEDLKDKRMKGNFRKVTDQYLERLLEIIDQEPGDFGYEFGHWTAQRLAEYLEKETGIKISSSQIRRIEVDPMSWTISKGC